MTGVPESGLLFARGASMVLEEVAVVVMSDGDLAGGSAAHGSMNAMKVSAQKA